ncbi:hypothetical protein HDU76_010081 [Blyttiomyces sp. JEL0837]|nr:hypothetical protein HDU76_010081 [Blyttiomyces sp. JEL0837]
MAKEWSTIDWVEKFCAKTGCVNSGDLRAEMRFDDVEHVIVLPNYKESLDTLCETLEVLGSHSRARSQYKICLAMEESEAGAERKAMTLVSRFSESFLQIVYTIHPKGREGEIRGKSSNVAWATMQMARKSKNHRCEIITVMDADTCFAEDYFMSITYFFCVCTPEQRRLQMFAPTTVFDRNSTDIPFIVRIADIMWSVGVMSNMYPSCPVRFPCSAYSVTMELAVAVGFWDAGPEAIGEDMHMYLKCFFSTEGRVRVEPIFSPASQCNIEEPGFFPTIMARFGQSKRHLWGGLDMGYSLRRALIAIIAPGLESAVGRLEDSKLGKKTKNPADMDIQFSLGTLSVLFHRLFEAHIMIGHIFLLLLMSGFVIPVGPEPSAFATAFWEAVTTESVDPTLLLCIDICAWIRVVGTLPILILLINYEKYHQWVAVDRWRLSAMGNDQPVGRAKVQPLGLRSQLVSVRTSWHLLDWFFVPLGGFLFQAGPQMAAQVLHLWTDRLDYIVAGKPQLKNQTPANPKMEDVAIPAPAGEPVAVYGGVNAGGEDYDLVSLRAHRIDYDGGLDVVVDEKHGHNQPQHGYNGYAAAHYPHNQTHQQHHQFQHGHPHPEMIMSHSHHNSSYYTTTHLHGPMTPIHGPMTPPPFSPVASYAMSPIVPLGAPPMYSRHNSGTPPLSLPAAVSVDQVYEVGANGTLAVENGSEVSRGDSGFYDFEDGKGGVNNGNHGVDAVTVVGGGNGSPRFLVHGREAGIREAGVNRAGSPVVGGGSPWNGGVSSR